MAAAPALAPAALDALGNPARREILRLLAERPHPVGALAARLPISRPAVSKHLLILEDAELVRHERRGTSNVYELAQGGFEQARSWLDSFWDDAMRRFVLAAENTAEGGS